MIDSLLDELNEKAADMQVVDHRKGFPVKVVDEFVELIDKHGGGFSAPCSVVNKLLGFKVHRNAAHYMSVKLNKLHKDKAPKGKRWRVGCTGGELYRFWFE